MKCTEAFQERLVPFSCYIQKEYDIVYLQDIRVCQKRHADFLLASSKYCIIFLIVNLSCFHVSYLLSFTVDIEQ